MENTYLNDDPFAAADNAKPRDFEVFGKTQVDARFIAFPGGGAKPVPFDPAIHTQDKMRTEVEIHIIPIAEQNISYDEYVKLLAESPDWTAIVNPSIKDLGIDGLRALNNQWVQVAKVKGKRKRLDKDTKEETGDFWPTYKFLKLFKSEDECRAAFMGGGTPSNTEPAAATTDPNKAAALAFARVLVAQVVNMFQDRAMVDSQVAAQIAAQPMIAAHYTAQSPEIQAAIEAEMRKQPVTA